MKTNSSRFASLRCTTAVVAFSLLFAATTSFAALFVSVAIAPPILPVYTQPVCPGIGYIWTPGYWAYGDEGYFWVPGTWVLAPSVGVLWTPGYWGWGGGAYLWHGGYWGPRVGFYGGVNYGFGYGGVGYQGGYWNNGAFYYNRSVNNVNVTRIQNTYEKTVVNNVQVNRVSYNGGTGGIAAQPTQEERLAESDRHVQATPRQLQHEQAASTNRAQLASVNHGQPQFGATQRPGAFTQSAAKTAGNPGQSPARNRNAAAGNAAGGGGAQATNQNKQERSNRQANAGKSPQNMSHPQNTAHAQNAPKQQSMSHAQNAPHPQTQPHAGQGGGGGEEHERH
jgi:hypothetical protein